MMTPRAIASTRAWMVFFSLASLRKQITCARRGTVLALVLGLLLSACGGGGDTGSSAATDSTASVSSAGPAQAQATAFVVTSVAPANGSVDVLPSAALRMEFSSEVDPASVNAQSVTLVGPQGNVPGKASASNTQVRFEPSTVLSAGARYMLQANTGLKAKDGTALAASMNTQFTVAAGQWEPKTAINTPDEVPSFNYSYQSKRVVKTPSGNVFMAWQISLGHLESSAQTLVPPNQVLFRHYDPVANSWGEITPIANPGAYLGDAQMALTTDAQGNAFFAYIESRQGTACSVCMKQALRFKKYDINTRQWSAEQQIDYAEELSPPSGIYNIYNPVLAADEQSNIWLAWTRLSYDAQNARNTQIVARYFDAASGTWSNDVLLSTGLQQETLNDYFKDIRLAIDPQGNTMALFTRVIGNSDTGYAAYYARYAAAGTLQWKDPGMFSADIPMIRTVTNYTALEIEPNQFVTRLAASPLGGFVVGGTGACEVDISQECLRVARFDPQTARWTPLGQIVPTGNVDLLTVFDQLKVDPAGNPVVLWRNFKSFTFGDWGYSDYLRVDVVSTLNVSRLDQPTNTWTNTVLDHHPEIDPVSGVWKGCEAELRKKSDTYGSISAYSVPSMDIDTSGNMLFGWFQSVIGKRAVYPVVKQYQASSTQFSSITQLPTIAGPDPLMPLPQTRELRNMEFMNVLLPNGARPMTLWGEFGPNLVLESSNSVISTEIIFSSTLAQ
jgi:hypothetical protein